MAILTNSCSADTWVSGQEIWFFSTRGGRVVAMTLLLAVLNVFDLWATVEVYQHNTLFEGNPFARYILDVHGVVGISLFKALLVAVAITGFVNGRRLLLAELGCAATTMVYLFVAWQWTLYPSFPCQS